MGHDEAAHVGKCKEKRQSMSHTWTWLSINNLVRNVLNFRLSEILNAPIIMLQVLEGIIAAVQLHELHYGINYCLFFCFSVCVWNKNNYIHSLEHTWTRLLVKFFSLQQDSMTSRTMCSTSQNKCMLKKTITKSK